MIKGKTKSGIKYSVNEEVKNDARFSYYSVKAMNEKLSETERSNAVFALISVLLGSEENLVIFMDEVAKKHNGVCNIEVMMSEINEIIEGIDAKKS